MSYFADLSDTGYTDLNDIKSIGSYRVLSADVASFTNLPISAPCLVTVENSPSALVQLRQTVTDYNSSAKFTRFYRVAQDAWTPWTANEDYYVTRAAKTGITSSSTSTVVGLGLITENGVYRVMGVTNSNGDTLSEYVMRVEGTTIDRVITVREGTNDASLRISSAGVVTKLNSTNNAAIYFMVTKIR